MPFEEFQKIYAALPHVVALYYSDIKRKFKLSHELAYSNTLSFASSIGMAVGQPGLPGNECRSKRLLLRSEI